MKLQKRVLAVLLSLSILHTSLPVFPARAIKDDAPTIIHSAAIDDSADETIGTFEIGDLTVGSDGKTITTEITASKNSTLIVALYDQNGSAMFSSARADVTGQETAQTVKVAIAPSGREDFIIKAFLLEPETYACRCSRRMTHYVKWMHLDGFSAPTESEISYSEEDNIHYINNTLLIFFEADATTAEIEAVTASINGKIIGRKTGLRLFQLRIAASTLAELDALAAAVMENDCVTYASYDRYVPDMTASISVAAPNDPWNNDVSAADWKDTDIDGSNWWSEAIDAQYAWAYEKEFSEIKIGIVDGSFDTEHEDLKNKFRFPSEQSEELNSTVSGKAYRHGTHVAGIIGAEHNTVGISGVTQKSELLLAPMPHCTNSELFSGFYDVIGAGAKVVNMSIGETPGSGIPFSDERLREFGEFAAVTMSILLEGGEDFIVVMSAGNGDANGIPMDAIQNGLFCSITEDTPTHSDSVSVGDVLDRVIVVGSAEHLYGNKFRGSSFSNYGAQVDLSAPGSDIYSTLPHTEGNEGNYDKMSGTSMAAPVVTGVCAMTWSARPELTGAEVRHLVCCSTDTTVAAHSYSDGTAYQMVNAQLSVENVLKHTADTVPVTVNVKYEDGTPAAGVTIESYNTDALIKTNTDGTAVFFLEKGRNLITAGTDGWFDMQQVEISRRTTVNLTLQETYVEWSVDETGTILTIDGWGPMPNYKDGIYSRSKAPWKGYAPAIKEIHISGSATIGDYAFYGFSQTAAVTFRNDPYHIGAYAFYGCPALSALTLPNSVFTIGDYAFYQCGFTSFTIPDGVVEIGQSVFSYCSALSQTTIPDSVTEIGSYAFTYSGLTSVSIPGGISEINYQTFGYCQNLTQVTISSSVKKIGSYAFAGCGLTGLTIPSSVSSIGESAFYGCKSLSSLSIANGVEEIGVSAFNNCTALTSVTIPGSVSSIGSQAFSYCSSLSALSIENGVKEIGMNAFYNCVSLTSAVIPGSVSTIGKQAFYQCNALTSLTLANGITSIGEYAFYNCDSLSSVTIPGTVTSFGSNAFSYCNQLASVTITEGATAIGEYAFKDCDSLTTVSIPSTITDFGAGAFQSCNALTSVMFAQGLSTIGSGAFSICPALSSITIPNSVTSIGASAFYKSTALTSITIPDSVTEIGAAAFQYSALSSVKLSNNLTAISDDMFQECKNLTAVTIPSSVTEIGNDAFWHCTNLTSVVIPEGVRTIGSSAFSGCEKLSSITIPSTVTDIYSSAFSGCPITSISIPSGITTISSGTFSSCEKLTSVSIPNSVTTIEQGAFSNCSALTSISIPDSVTEIGSSAFAYCSNLSDVKLSNNITQISSKMFEVCPSLTSISIPSGVTQIVAYAFQYSGLQSISIPYGVEKIQAYAFRDCSGLKSISIPETVTSIGQYATDNCSSLTDVYYGGSKAQYEEIEIGYRNDLLQPDSATVTIHYAS